MDGRQTIQIEDEALHIVFRDGTWWSCHEDHLKEAVKLYCETRLLRDYVIAPGSRGNISSLDSEKLDFKNREIIIDQPCFVHIVISGHQHTEDMDCYISSNLIASAIRDQAIKLRGNNIEKSHSTPLVKVQ